MKIVEHVSVAAHTTFRVGGSARFLALINQPEELEGAFQFASARSVPMVLMGGGSNMLVDDGEAEALFVLPQFKGVEMQTADEGSELTFCAGELWDTCVAFAVERGLWGFENLSGIPGTLGGAIVQNIGAYGAALSQTVLWVEVMDVTAQKNLRLSAAECQFGYRTSIFKQFPGRYVIIRAAFVLRKNAVPNLSYADVRDALEGKETPTLAEIRRVVLGIRARKFPDLTVEGSAGSFFKNPMVSKSEAQHLQALYPTLPLFRVPESTLYKVPLAWILDKALSMRGFSVGLVRCFETQPLVLVAKRGAKASEVRKVAYEVQKKVLAHSRLQIEPEVCVMNGAEMTSRVDF